MINHLRSFQRGGESRAQNGYSGHLEATFPSLCIEEASLPENAAWGDFCEVISDNG